MRYAIFSDVHANLRAWEQVLADIRGQQVDVLICLGDAVGYGPKPEEVLHGIRSITDNFVMGNHDAAAAGVLDYSIFNDQAKHSIEWTAQSLSQDSLEYLGSVPLAIDAGDILFVHAEISEPGRFSYIDSLESAAENFVNTNHFVTFVGHTHHPNIFEVGGDGEVVEYPDSTRALDPSCRYIVNVGSVGEPRVPDDLRGVYVVYDSDTRVVDYRKVAFDIEAYRQDLESTSLGVKPFFLQCYEYQVAENHTANLTATQALSAEAPAASHALVRNQTGPVKLHVPKLPPNFSVDLELGVNAPSKSKRAKVVTCLILSCLILASVIAWKIIEDREVSLPEEITFASDTASIIETESGESEDAEVPESPRKDLETPEIDGAKSHPEKPANPPAPETKPKPASPSKPKPKLAPDPVVAWWRMEEDSEGAELIDASGKHSLSAESPGSRMGRVAPPVIPANGKANESALGSGVWREKSLGGAFELRADRSFTFEGWLITDTPRVPIFVAGTRSGEANDSQGWHLDIRTPTEDFPNGRMCFFYDNGPEIIQALSDDVVVADLKPHHFAAVWDHDMAAAVGEMRLFLDGKKIASASISHDLIPKKAANPFRIGAITNPPRIGLDEVRFSQAGLGSRQFLNVAPEIVLLDEDFESPDVTGFQKKAVPPGWVGSGAGFGTDRRGLIDVGKGSEFSTPDGKQAYHLAYANAGITSGAAAVREVLTAGHTYRVSFQVGAKKGTKSDYHVELVAFDPKHDNAARADTRRGSRPGVVLATASGMTESHDLSQTVSFAYKAEPTSPHLGKPIGIRLARFAHNGSPLFDKIRLTSKTDGARTLLSRPSPASVPPDLSKASPASKAGDVKGHPKDRTIAWWRMEGEPGDSNLVDALKKHSLSVREAGKPIAALAPEVIPSNGAKNTSAMGLGVWGESKPNPQFALTRNRSFTLEGWFLTARPRVPIFLAGTRSGDAKEKQGWHLDVRPQGVMSFFYDIGPETIQALSEELPLGDFQPHHFAAVWDHDAGVAAGEMRLYFDGERVASALLLHMQIPESPANPFRIGAPTNPPKIGLDEVRFSHDALSPLEFLRAETQSMTKAGKWMDGANWSASEPPSKTQTAVLGVGIAAQLEKTPTSFAGDLVLQDRSKLVIHTPEAFAAVVPKTPSKLVLNQGSEIILIQKSVPGGNPFKRIELAGNATIRGGRSTQGHHASRVFAREISGKGALILDGVNNNQFVFAAASRFKGGLVAKSTQKQGFQVIAKVPGSLGLGNVEVGPHASLVLEAEGAISPESTLKLVGEKNNRAASKVILNANNTITSLAIGGDVQKAGEWGAVGSGADHEHAVFSGPGILTVRR